MEGRFHPDAAPNWRQVMLKAIGGLMAALSALIGAWAMLVIGSMVGPAITALLLNYWRIELAISEFIGLFSPKVGAFIGDLTYARWFFLLYGIRLLIGFAFQKSESSSLKVKVNKE